MKARASLPALVFTVAFLATFAGASASTVDGTIDSTSKYAWGENIGWVNFGTSGGDVHVTDSAVTGYAWNENYGWINMAPSGSGVANDNEGTLSGQAWGENLGWIDFEGVVINSDGQFTGSASGTVSGQINFDCSNCTVVTDWRPASSRGGGGSGGGPTGGGGSAPVRLGVLINGNAAYTVSPEVTLNITADSSVADVLISNYPDFHDGIRERHSATKTWNLCNEYGVPRVNCAEGVYTVYVRFYSAGGVPYGPFTDSILYSRTAPPAQPPFVPPPSRPSDSFLGSIGKILEPFIPDFLKPKPKFPDDVAMSPEQYLARETPLAFQDRWNLLPERSINEFVFAPLPENFTKLVEKLPDLKKIVKEVGITKQADLQKLRGITLLLPGFTGTTLQKSFNSINVENPRELAQLRSVVLKLPGFASKNLVGSAMEIPHIALPPGVPLEQIPEEIKENVPSEIMFVKVGDEKIDLDIALNISESGVLQQSFRTLPGSIVKLIVKPEHEAERVTGYLALKTLGGENALGAVDRPGFSMQAMLGSIVFNAPNLAAPAPSARYKFIEKVQVVLDKLAGKSASQNIEERFALREFEYVDPDGDGIYTATIQAPVVDGEYDVYTIIDYKDAKLASKEIKLTTVIDPEGYVYESIGSKELRIPGAVVTLYALDDSTKAYKMWDASGYGQQNPQVTDVRGTYAFLVPPGFYYLNVDAPGYDAYRGRSFEVQAGGPGVHTNIELGTKYGWLRVMDWKTALLILVTMLLLFNFYKDRRRAATGRA